MPQTTEAGAYIPSRAVQTGKLLSMPLRETVSGQELRDLESQGEKLRAAAAELRRLRVLYREKRRDMIRKLLSGAVIVDKVEKAKHGSSSLGTRVIKFRAEPVA